MAKILMQSLRWRTVGPVLAENGLVTSILVLVAYLQLGAPAGDAALPGALLSKAVLAAIALQCCMHWGSRSTADGADRVARLLRELGIASLALACLYLSFPAVRLGGAIFIPAAALLITVLPLWEAAADWIVDRLGPRERLLIIGTRPAVLALARELIERRRGLGVEIVGFIEPDPAAPPVRLPYPGIVGTIADVPAIVRAQSVTRVVVSLADARGRLPMDDLLAMRLDGVTFDHLASVYEEYTGKIALENLRPSWFIFSSGFRKSATLRLAKRLTDLVAATVVLVLTAPVMLLVALAVRLTSNGPAVYHQQRTGQHGRVFTIHKFRTMRTDAEANGAQWARAHDPRVTPIGAVLRRYRLDELPQLWNVFRGDMSVVGPRPERPEFVQDLTKDIPFYGQRHVVKPGLTGWAQVRYTYAASVEDTMQKLQYELFYIKNMSLSLDLYILFATVKTVLMGEGAR